MRNWISDRWSGGAYSDLVVDMHATDAEKLISHRRRRPSHFASSELSPSFPGYIEGAIVAGRAAAAKCIASLSIRHRHQRVRIIAEAHGSAERQVVGAEIIRLGDGQRLFHARTSTMRCVISPK